MKVLLYLLPLSFLFTSFNNKSEEYEFIEIVNLVRKPVIKGSINGKDAYFLVDTGSDLSFLNINDKEYFDYDFHKSFKGLRINGMGGKVYGVKQVSGAKLQLGSQYIYARFLSCDIQHLVDSFEATSNIKINGIIGSDTMINYGFRIDYENRQIGIAIKDKLYTKN
ncbi:MAG: hypothetical protein CMO01_06425 [Thalassobius sp.]|nr:hypothetical protein [Thalassovita sp.]